MGAHDAAPVRRPHFRPDVEGLRAVAVVAVLLYHCGVPGIPGGFVGVDVFYVISGFLITGLLWRELESTGRLDLRAFYARRMRRLLPASLLVIGVTLIASWLLMSRLRFPAVAGDAVAATLYVSNIRFALGATDYLAGAAAPSPLLHTWSLGVEEQFYLVWPVLLLVLSRMVSRARVAWVLAGIGVASFLLSAIWTDVAAPWAFFSLPTRIWELAGGALLAVGFVRLPRRTGAGTASLIGILGIGLLGTAMLTIDAETPFPGIAAVVPVAATLLLILAGERAEALHARALAQRIPRWLGRISYSLYLWHWPVLVLVPIWIGRDDLPTRLLLALVAVGIATVSTELIELPIREQRALRATTHHSLGAALVATGGMAAFGIALASLGPLGMPTSPVAARAGDATPPPTASAPPATPVDGRPTMPGVIATPTGAPDARVTPTPAHPSSTPTAAPTPTPTRIALVSQDPIPTPDPTSRVGSGVLSGPIPAGVRPSLEQVRDDLPRSYTDGCHLDFGGITAPACSYGITDPDRPLLMLVGDSHAAQWLPAAEHVAAARGWRLIAITKSGCPYVAATVWNKPLKRGYRECDAWRAQVAARIAAERPAILLLAASRGYQVIDDGGRHAYEDSLRAWRTGLRWALTDGSMGAGHTVLLADTPRLLEDPVECLARSGTIDGCPTPRQALTDAGHLELEASTSAAAGVTLIPTEGWLCDATSCPLVMDGLLVYRDDQHLTATFAAGLAGLLGASLDPLIRPDTDPTASAAIRNGDPA